jgi:protein phosphatase
MQPNSSPFTWRSATRTHTGRVRTHNEDASLEQPERGLWAIADGMGGHTRGEFASRLIVDVLAQAPNGARLSGFVTAVETAVLDANRQLIEHSSRLQQTIGSTLVALLIRGRHCVTMWAGDSRAYRMRRNHCQQLTTDHSQAERFVDLGLLSRTEAAQHPAAHLLTRAVGVVEPLALDVDIDEVTGGDRFLLCSDGLDRHVSNDEIARTLKQGTPEQAASALIDLTLARGAIDNVTVTIVDILPRTSNEHP